MNHPFYRTSAFFGIMGGWWASWALCEWTDTRHAQRPQKIRETTKKFSNMYIYFQWTDKTANV